MKPPVIAHTVAVVSIHPLQRVVENSSSYVKVVRIATFIFRFAYGRSWKLWNDQLPSLLDKKMLTEMYWSRQYLSIESLPRTL